MKIRHINKVISNMGIGVTNPLHCTLDNGVSVIFKTFHNEQGNLTLANEMISYRIAQRLGLTIPNAGIAQIDDDTTIMINDRNIPKGIGFFSTRIGKAITSGISQSLLLKRCTNRNELPKFIMFDHLIYNRDRNPGNILYSMEDEKVYIIDHSHCFNLQCIWDEIQLNRCIKENDFKDTLIMERNYDMYRKFIGIDNVNLPIFLEIKDEFVKMLDRSFFIQIINELPDEWGVGKKDGEALADYLEYRLNNLESMCKIIINYIQGR